jgi:hypothetical protein
MDPLEFAFAKFTPSSEHARSALPNAPVVPDTDSFVRVRYVRTVAASGLRRLADVIAPPRPVVHGPRGLATYAGGEAH